MAKIFKTSDQETALKEIMETLKLIDSMNTILKDENISGLKIRLTGTVTDGAINEIIPIPFPVISSQLKDYRKRLIKDVMDKSKNYNILLDDNDSLILGITPETNNN